MATVAGAPVVVGTDGSPCGLTAVGIAAEEAALRHRRLRIVHAPAHAGADRGAGHLAEAVAAATRHLSRDRVTADTLPGAGAPALVAAGRGADLLVVGERGAGGAGGFLIGSVAMHVTAHATGPVLIVREARRPDGPIVAGVDGTAESVAALAFAVEEAALRRADLLALHVWDPPHGGGPADGAGDECRLLAEVLAGLGERYPDVRVHREVCRGPAHRLLAARARAARLVVVGRQARAGFAGLLLGSVCHHLACHAACPTAVVPQPA